MIYIFFIGLGLCILFTPQNALLDDALQIKEPNVESDDDKLNQALILVDILKTVKLCVDHFEHHNCSYPLLVLTVEISGIVEYVKLLRQNIQLRNGDESVIEEVDQATCAANATEAPGVTVSMTNDTNGNHTAEATTGGTGSAPLPAGTPPSQAQPRPLVPNLTTPAAMAYYDMPMPQLPFPLHQKPFQAPRRFFRRRIPDYYYYDLPRRRRLFNEPPVVGQLQRNKVPPPYYEKTLPKGDFRRFDYDNDPFNDTPTTVLTTTTTSTSTTRTTTAGTVAVTSQSTTSDVQGSSDTTTMTTPATPRTSPTTKARPTSTAASSKPTVNTAAVTRRPSVKTTASISPEIRRETLKGKVRYTPSSLQTTKDPVDAEVASELVKELKKEGITLKKFKFISSTNPTTDVFDSAFKTSIRIYLEKSTRYPIPLPENHAFCYTNPNNPLCRTLIR